MPKMPERGRADVEAEAVAVRTALRRGPIAEEATAAGETILSLETCGCFVVVVCGVAVLTLLVLSVSCAVDMLPVCRGEAWRE